MGKKYVYVFSNLAREVLERRYLKEIDEINSVLSEITDVKEIDQETLSRIIELETKRKRLKKLLRDYRKLDIIRARVAIIKAKSFIKRMFDSLGEFSKKAVAIYGICRIILDIVEQVKQLVHKKKSRNGSFLFG
ncbi:hypothetical protein [Desulfosporosinus youngiae]|uniref:Uncharacterized protein n=1 Tax=Desulfosporosinus youngiae DSM 17734 TaxID=768710 RepID=H5Y582_9FIRM|nr:hypothetical protein [Desulfosporosinus youngiae]EHQ90186.1 hypothetical protein DesyoDRAFT_3152 [Desulfosporosinus youngiae DSM 17734]